MTPEIYDWASRMLVEYDLDLPVQPSAPRQQVRVVEVGSHNRHPPTEPGGLRKLFTDAIPVDFLDYFGVDLEAGPGVDVVLAGADPALADFGPFDVAIYTEVMEHDLTFWRTWANLNNALDRGGHLLVSTCANGFPRHDYPADYYRFSVESLVELGGEFGFRTLETNNTVNGVNEPSVMGLFRKEREVGRCSD